MQVLKAPLTLKLYLDLQQTNDLLIPSLLARDHGESVQTISYHLIKMYRVGLVDRVRHGRHVYYSLNHTAQQLLKDLF